MWNLPEHLGPVLCVDLCAGYKGHGGKANTTLNSGSGGGGRDRPPAARLQSTEGWRSALQHWTFTPEDRWLVLQAGGDGGGAEVHAVQPMALVWAPSRSEVLSGPRLFPGAGDRVGGGLGPAALLQRQLTKNKLGCQGLLVPEVEKKNECQEEEDAGVGVGVGGETHS